MLELTSFHIGEQVYALLDGMNRPDVELPGLDCLDHLIAQHQIAHVAKRDDDALLAGQPFGLAGQVEALDLLVHTADSLDLASLVDRARQGAILAQRDAGDGRE